MLFGFAVVPYTTPNAASSPKRTNTWSPPPRAAVAPVSSTSWLLLSVPDRAAGSDPTTPLAVAASRSARRKCTRELIRPDGRRRIGRRTPPRDRTRREFHRHGGRIRVGPQRGDPRRGPPESSGRRSYRDEGRR